MNSRFSAHNQPKGRGRPKGAQNIITREIREAVLIAAQQLGEDDKGKDALIG
jgi:hypothetical protein